MIPKAPPDVFIRFEWSLPFSKGIQLKQLITTHQWANDGFILASDIEDLKCGDYFHIQAAHEASKESPDLDDPERRS